LLSIQSIIFQSQPYFNQLGYQRTRPTATATDQSLQYFVYVRQATVRSAIIQQLPNPSICFYHIIRQHLFLKRNEIIYQCQSWIEQL
ncbi:unnamed protein product, partial [Rotaria sp. Silwood2]